MASGLTRYVCVLAQVMVVGVEEVTQSTFEYGSPLGVLGRLADALFLKAYLRRFLQKRDAELKAWAEKA